MPESARDAASPYRVDHTIRVRCAPDVVAVLDGELLQFLSLSTRRPIPATPSVITALEACAGWTPVANVPVDGGGVEYLLHVGLLTREDADAACADSPPPARDDSARTDVVRCAARNYPLYRVAPTAATDHDRREFDRCFEAAVSRGPGHAVVLDSSLARHEFLAHLARRGNVLFHGSNRVDLSLLHPGRRSVDCSPHGNREGVYSTGDGMVAMLLAVLDRARYRGAVGIEWISLAGEGGSERRAYRFSVGRHWLRAQPWTRGAVYIVPKDSFEQCRRDDGVLVDEWVSQTPVRPLAMLPVLPEDFPMLTHVAGHDDEPFRRFLELEKKLFERSLAVEELPDGYRQRHAWDESLAATILEWAALRRVVEPSGLIELLVEPFGGPVWLRIRGPNALKAVRKDLLKKDAVP